MRRSLRTDFVGGAGTLDPAAIAQVAAEAWPEVRDADELHDALLTSDHAAARARMAARISTNCAPPAARQLLVRGGRSFWIATERRHAASDADPDDPRLDGIARSDNVRRAVANVWL